MEEITKRLTDWIVAEVDKQVTPINSSISDLRRQGLDQSAKIADIDRWRRALWGNGHGPPGYLEAARAEDKSKYDMLLSIVTELRASSLRQEGKEELQREINENRLKIAQLNDSRKVTRLTRMHLWIGILSCFCGAWTLALIRPILKVMFDYLARVLAGG